MKELEIKLLRNESRNPFVNSDFKHACEAGAKSLEAWDNVKNKLDEEIGSIEYTNTDEDKILRAYEDGLQKSKDLIDNELPD